MQQRVTNHNQEKKRGRPGLQDSGTETALADKMKTETTQMQRQNNRYGKGSSG